MANCFDCQRPYGDEHGFPDLVIPDWAWSRIAPKPDGDGLLCSSCICKRLHDADICCEHEFMSGPLRQLTDEERFVRHLNEASAIVETWPEWKRNVLSHWVGHDDLRKPGKTTNG